MSRTSAVGSWILNSSIDTSMFSSSTDFSVDGTYFCDGSISTLTKISIDPSPRAFSLYSYLMLYCPTNGNTSGITSFYFSYQNSKMAPSQDGTYIRTGSPSVFSTINSTESDFNDYKIFTITGGDDVANADLISWLEANATFVEDTKRISIDLTTLSGYEALAAGTYNIAVKAKADGYQDSDLSETVEYTKEADLGVTVLYNDQPVNAVTYDGQTVNKIVYEEATT